MVIQDVVSTQRSTDGAVAILILFPYSHSGIVSRENSPISIPRIPKASAGPRSFIQLATKNVHANATTARNIVTITKQSVAR
jgi:hypothetical protein